MAKSKCDHKNFFAKVDVNRLTDVGRFAADIRINCERCGVPFRFKGLEVGLDLNGARMSLDGQEARLAIEPVDEPTKPETGVIGFTVTKR